MTVEQNLAKMQKEYEQLSNKEKKKTVKVGERDMTVEDMIDEVTIAYSKLDYRQKLNTCLDPDTGLMMTSGDSEKALRPVSGAL